MGIPSGHTASVQSVQLNCKHVRHVVGEYYWKLAADGPVSRYPKLISHRWQGLPGSIDAAFALPSGKIYFLKGDKTWAYKDSSLLPKYPRLISDVWKGIPNNVDAAMYYAESTFFFFKGKSFCTFMGSNLKFIEVSTGNYDGCQNCGGPGDPPPHIMIIVLMRVNHFIYTMYNIYTIYTHCSLTHC
jgi:hypothetical protein